MSVPLLDLPAQHKPLREELDRVWAETLDSAAFIGGPRVKRLEKEIADYVGVTNAVACGNGTDALYLIMKALKIGPGDEVITTPFTFWATLEAIVNVGATPVFVDIDPATYNIDVNLVESAITARTKAIIPVHIFGQCAEMDPLREIAIEHGLYLVEDACQAIGATYKNVRAGALGNIAAFSFFPSKNLGCFGDGGMITTNDPDLAARCRKLASHGTSQKYFHDAFGQNSRLDPLQAGILSAKLPYLDSWNTQRRVAAKTYDRLLEDSGLQLPVWDLAGDPVYHLYVVKAKNVQLAERLMGYLKACEVSTALYYPLALHEQAAFDADPNFVRPHLPVAESCDGRTFALPCFPGITLKQIEYVVDCLESVL